MKNIPIVTTLRKTIKKFETIKSLLIVNCLFICFCIRKAITIAANHIATPNKEKRYSESAIQSTKIPK